MTGRIAITGMGVVTSLGGNVPATWGALVAGSSGISRITRFPTTGLKTAIGGSVEIPVPDGRCITRTRLMAEAALGEALTHAGLDGAPQLDVPLVVGMTGWEFEWADRRVQAMEARERTGGSFFARFDHEGNRGDNIRDGSLVAALQRRFRIIGPGTSVTTACASGATAIELAARAIRRGRTKLAIAGASDGNITPESLVRFGLLATLSQASGVPERASRPFSRGRDGFVMAEGAGFIVLEDEQSARERGVVIAGYLLGAGSNSDAFHRTRSRPDGSGGSDCIERALRDACVDARAVEYVNAHGTSTPENDRMETKVLKRAFQAHAYELLVSSNKSMLGHCLAAAGAIEAVATVKALQTGVVPPTINYEPDDELDLNYVPNVAQEREIKVAVSTSFGFGGQNVALVFGRYPS